jgi:peptidoglycan/LPS O-acetylase OafA/YrhL
MNLNLIKSESRSSDILDFLRFILAAMVVFYHGGLDFIPGYEAVIVFFVLSGYFISTSVLKAFKQKRWSWRVYLINRLTRLWIVLIPALLLSALWGYLQIAMFNNGNKFDGVMSIGVFLKNLLFLQGINSPIFGLNGPLWSLSYEFWYYILFPCIVLIFVSPKKTHKLFYVFLVVGLSFFLGEQIMKYFLLWGVGAIIPMIKHLEVRQAWKRRILTSIATAIFFVCINLLYILYHSNHAEPKYIIDISVAVSFAFLLYLLASFYNEKERMTRINFSFYAKYLAGLTYTLYLTHYPLMLFLREFLYSGLKVSEGSLLELALRLGILPILFIYAWLIACLTEFHTDKVKNLFLHRSKNKSRIQKTA